MIYLIISIHLHSLLIWQRVLESDRVKKASNEELIIIARENNFNLENYLIKN